MKQRFNVYDTLAMIRIRPEMYLGSSSLRLLRAFLDGCFFMAHQYGLEANERPEFLGFHDWVARRFGWSGSALGWCNIIIQECDGDEGKALDRFFELLEEYQRTAANGRPPQSN